MVSIQDDDVIVISCQWCSDPTFVKNHLNEFIKSVGDHSKRPSWFDDAAGDLCSCFDCVEEYHKAVERDAVRLYELAYKNDTERLELYLGRKLEQIQARGKSSCADSDDEEEMSSLWPRLLTLQKDLECPLKEMLKYPHLLLQSKLAKLFTEALLELEDNQQSFEVNWKYPGVYLLLVHPNHQVELRTRRLIDILVITCI